MYYEVVGEGKAMVFLNGKVVEGTWEKESQTDQMRFFDSKGKEIELARGATWVEIVPRGNEIDY